MDVFDNFFEKQVHRFPFILTDAADLIEKGINVLWCCQMKVIILGLSEKVS